MNLPDLNLFMTLFPELALVGVAAVLFLLGIGKSPKTRRIAPILAGVTLLALFGIQWVTGALGLSSGIMADNLGAARVGGLAQFVKLISCAVCVPFVLMAWPTNKAVTGNAAMDVGSETPEFFGLMMLSIAGVFLVASANDLILLFLGFELAAIPTYIMVSVSRPLPVSQEAGVKYFFLGALAAAVLLLGLSYLYGSTGAIQLNLTENPLPGSAPVRTIAQVFADANHVWTPWQLMAVVLVILGFSFKMAAVPLHFYVADVYQGAATPVTAFLSYIPKTSGLIAIIKILSVTGGPDLAVDHTVYKLLWAMAVLTMTVGNVLATVQPYNIKRVMAYSSVANSGYMLAAAVAAGTHAGWQNEALTGVLFYLLAYGVMNAGTLAALQMLPARGAGTPGRPDEREVAVASSVEIGTGANSAETFDDIAGLGRRHPVVGLCLAICCFSLIGLPLTVGFFGKLLIIKPALDIARGGEHRELYWLVVIVMLNAAISAMYYLKIIAAMFLRPDPDHAHVTPHPNAPVVDLGHAPHHNPVKSPWPVAAALGLSAAGTVVLGVVLPATHAVTHHIQENAAVLDVQTNLPVTGGRTASVQGR